ncbi:glutamate cyclase domain-containing protein [Mesorhizobium sp. CAU 1741]|uniref:glutamate cyclase domain-containing protein n=1 Tax=Mesorhizobium sp. CAU 1741 TaxID=3140366 RepID=UPI00325B168E
MTAYQEHPNLENICRQIDRLTTVEMRISDYSRGVIAKLHEAAVEAQGGLPLSLLAARHIMANAKEGRYFFVVTGAGNPRFLPAGETDGPPGAVALALAIHAATGAVPILLTDEPFVANVEATALAAGLGLRDISAIAEIPYSTAVLPLVPGDAAEATCSGYLDRFDPCLMISIEKIGPAANGVAHSASGKPVGDTHCRAEPLFEEGTRRGVATLGIGDNGNEIGYGKIVPAIHKHKPSGETLATRVETDVLVAANTSNWGGYGIIAAMAALMQKPELAHTAKAERRILEANVAFGAADGSTGRHIMAVDGMDEEVQYAVVTMLQHIVRNGLISGFKRRF